MPTFFAPDGTELAYHLHGEGLPLVCLPGGPMQDSTYLAELGGLSAHRQLIMVDPRGTGQSAIPADVSSYRCDRLVDDVEALRDHLRLEQFALLAHSAGANIAVLYAARYPQRISKLVLVAPSTMAVGITVTGEARVAAARLRKREPWFEAAFAALEGIIAGNATEESWQAIGPFYYGRWDSTTQNYQTSHDSHRNNEAAATFAAEGAFEPDAIREALAALDAPVLLVAGEFDLNSVPSVVAEFSAVFPNAEAVVQPGAGHFPWHEDAEQFVKRITAFLG